MKKYVIGMDIGGTNTDAVLVDDQERIVQAVKTSTTDDISQGFSLALQQLLDNAGIAPDRIEGIFLGTTHATNAILQKKDLFRVGIIRIAGQRPDMLPTGISWPCDLKEAVIVATETIGGGLECHGGALTTLCQKEARSAIQRLLDQGVESLAIIGVFSPLNGEQEKLVANLISGVPVSLSYEIGGIGFIERENSTVLNAALKGVMETGFRRLEAACTALKLTCPLMITQNDGSLITMARAIDYPVLTISAGPTNSFMGGCRLARLDQAIVVDIGGTSTDVGLIRNGVPVRSLNRSMIGGVALNFPMPDVLSIALGGGSLVDLTSMRIGPQSVAKNLKQQALSFGGDQLTLTDIALSMGYVCIPGANTIPSLPENGVFAEVKRTIETLVYKVQGQHNNLPVILVGGGAALLSTTSWGERFQIPAYFDVANAYGAALAEISGTVDTVVSLQQREEVLNRLYDQARCAAIAQGACPETLRLVDQQIIPYHYVPNHMARVVVRCCGSRKSKNPT